MIHTKKAVLAWFALVPLLLLSARSNAQISLSTTSAVVENFNSMGATTTLPSNWRFGASTSSPTWATATGTLTQQASSGSPTAGGSYNWGATSSERCPGAMTSGSFGSPNSVIGNYSNGGSSNITQLAVSYKGERYRTNSANASVQFFYSLNGTSWTAVTAGDIATSSFPTGSSAYNFASGTSVTVASFNITGLAITPGSGFYLRWNINTTGTNSQGIGVDDISVTPTFATVCAAVTSSSASNITTTSADISWGSVSGATGYEYQVTTTASTPSSGTSTTLTSVSPSSLTANTKYYVHVRTACSGGVFSSWKKDSFNTAAGAVPTISIAGSPLSFGQVITGATTAEQSYSVSGSNLTANISVTAPTGFSISLVSGSGYGSSLTLTQSGGTVNSTPVYVIYTPQAATGAVSTTVSHASTGATTQTCTLTATAISTEPSVSGNLTFGTTASTSMVVNFSGGDGAKRIVVARAGSAVNYAPSDATAATGVSNVFTSATDQGNGNRIVYDGTASAVTLTGLTANTTYHFAVYEYNVGTGTSQNYKTTTPVTANNATLDEAIYLTGTSAVAYTENFNSIGTSATAVLPTGFQVSGATLSPVYGTSVTTATTLTYGSTGTGVVNGTSPGGFINWANGVAGSSTDRSLGMLSTGSYTSPRSLMVKVKNATDSTITSLVVTYDVEKLRSGSRATNVNFYYSANGSTWTLKESTAYPADANNTVISNPPVATAEEAVISGLSLAANSSCYLRWEFDANGNTNCQGLGVDNITITPFSTTRITGNSDLGAGSYNNLNVVDVAGLEGDVTLNGRIHFANGSKLLLNDHTLTINGTVSGDVNISGSGLSSLIVSGTGTLATIGFDQSAPGTSNRLKDLEINRSGAALALGNTLEVTGTVTPTSGTLQSNGNLVLVSDASGTARIAAIAALADVTGNVTVQRYIPAVTRRSRALSAPVSNFKFDQYIDDLYLSGPGGITNGFDASPSNSNSIFTYQESADGTGRGWKNISAITNTLAAGSGALVFVRGDRTIGSTQWYTAPFPAQNEVTVDFASQPINKGTISPAITYTNTGVPGDDGWNLVGNPYASPIDWTLLTRQDLASFYYALDPSTGSYVADNGSELIASGQAFFVQAINNSPSITFTEAAKASGTPVSYFKTGSSKIGISMIRDQFNADNARLVIDQGASRGYVPTEDAIKLTNALINLGFYIDSNTTAQVNAVPLTQQADTFPLITDAPAGTYLLRFSNVASVPLSKAVYLRDLFMGTTTDLRATDTLCFTISSSPASTQKRFELIITGISNPLPVKLLSFTGAIHGQETKLSWKVVNEKNIHHYLVQQSADGIAYTDLGLVKATNINALQEYFYTTKSNNAKDYYRLCIVEKSGAKIYSNVVAVGKSDVVIPMLSVYPNPIQAGKHARLAYTLPGGVPAQITLLNAMGKEVYAINKQETESGEHELVLPPLASGLYYIVFITGDERKVIKLIMQ